jgi:succinyl-CoA synthetase beta subunit
VARTPLEVRDAVKSLGGSCTLQAQVLWGLKDSLSFEDGLRGGNQTVQDADHAMSMADRMLNSPVVSDNIGHQSITVNQILVSEVMAHQELWHLTMTIDRENYCPAIIISKQGGNTNTSGSLIQANHPKSSTFVFGFSQGITRDLVIQISEFLGVAADQVTNLGDTLTKMYGIFREKDATLLEIAPLARLENGLFASLDARLVIDDDAAKRQPDIFRLRDTSQEVEDEVKAERHNLVYIKMDGNIGNIVNGAGLAMATNDAIGLHGGASANFLDAGGQATKETMIQAFGIVMGDERVKAILINIYGGEKRTPAKDPESPCY